MHNNLHSSLYLNGAIELLVETEAVDLTGLCVCNSEGPCIHYSGVGIICRQLTRTGYSEKLISMFVQVSHRNTDTGALKLTEFDIVHFLSYFLFFSFIFFLFLHSSLRRFNIHAEANNKYGCENKLTCLSGDNKKKKTETEHSPL